MTADSQWALQLGIRTALIADGTLTALVPAARIKDHIPQPTVFPYISIGETSAGPFDTKTEDGMEQTFTIHTWSRHRGLKEVKQIMGAIVDVLDQAALSVSGHTLVLVRFEFSDTILDPDGKTRHGVQRFRAITQGT